MGAHIEAATIPVMEVALALAVRGPDVFPGGACRNLEFVEGRVELSFAGEPASDPCRRLLLADPMTSGGLLVAVPPAQAARFAELLAAGLSRVLKKQEAGRTTVWCSRIGSLTDRTATIVVR